MEITINQQSTEIPEGSSVDKLLSSFFPVSTRGIAVAVNQNIIPRITWSEHILNPDDKITLIKATQGG